MRKFSFFLMLLNIALYHQEALGVVLTSKDKPASGRWIYESKIPLPKKEPARTLVELKRAKQNSQWAQCLRLADRAISKAPMLGPWILGQRFECLKDMKSNGVALDNAIRTSEKNPDWLLFGPYSSKLKVLVVEAYLNRLEQVAKKDRVRAEDLLDKAIARQDWMDPSQKARAYQIGGELAFVRQRLKVAESYFQKSLMEKDSIEVRERIKSVLALLKKKPVGESEAKAAEVPNLDAPPKEQELADRMAAALKSGDLVSAVEDGIEIISDFPGSQRAKWATDRIYEVYSSVAIKNDPQYAALKKRILKEMESVDGQRILMWSERAFRLGFYEDVVQLSNSGIKKLKGTISSTKIISLAAHSATFTGDDRTGRNLFQELVSQHSGTDEALRALFRLGLMDFRNGDHISAAANFERLLVYPDGGKLELQGRYWLWRSLQSIDKGKAQKIGQELAERYPLTYYGLRAKAELGDGYVEIPNDKIEITENYFLSTVEERGWKRLNLLLEAGWHEEAQMELSALAEPTSPKLRALLAQYWASAFDYPTAIRLINRAWDEEASLMGEPFIRMAFPVEFKGTIDEHSKKNSLDPDLIRSLIRQESSYSPVAVSPAGAQGLMQLMPSTSSDMAGDLGLKKKGYDVFHPETNIRFGTRFLQRIIKRFDGNIALALAAYNVGPERLQRWMKARNLSPQLTSDPTYEVWIDEMPWSETSFYVKAILRNLLIYRALDKSRVRLANPIWASDES